MLAKLQVLGFTGEKLDLEFSASIFVVGHHLSSVHLMFQGLSWFSPIFHFILNANKRTIWRGLGTVKWLMMVIDDNWSHQKWEPNFGLSRPHNVSTLVPSPLGTFSDSLQCFQDVLSVIKFFFCFFFVSVFPWQYTVREAAKAADLWNSAPYLDKISPEQMQRFYGAVCLINGEISSVATMSFTYRLDEPALHWTMIVSAWESTWKTP